MPLIASVTVASFAATDGDIAAIKSSTPTAPMIALVFISITSGTDYTALHSLSALRHQNPHNSREISGGTGQIRDPHAWTNL
jgi:hypothetical protein